MNSVVFVTFVIICGVFGCVSGNTREQGIGSLRRHFGYETPTDGSSTIDVSFSNNNEDYSILVNNNEWLVSGLTSLINNKEWATLQLNGTESHSGNDNFGDYDEFTLFWQNSNDANTILASGFRTYPNNEDIVVLTQTFPNGASNMATNNIDGIVSSFPSFKIKEASNKSIDLGFVHFSGFMASAEFPQYGRWKNGSNFMSTLNGGVENTGPLCIYSSDLNNAIVISALTYHMAASDNVTLNNDNNNYEFRFGIIGNVSSVPIGFKINWIISLTKYGGGINNAMHDWGDKLLTYYNKQRGNAHLRDYTLNYLGYSTDNGAYYYYETEPNKNYEETIIDLKNYLDKESIPVRYILLDSWWYYKGVNGGVKNWKAQPSVFPDGMSYLHNVTNWPIQAHNRYWSLDNIYANNNPPPYNNNTNKNLFSFEFSGYDGLPKTREFWDYLFEINNDWGLIVYEQDWLSTSSSSIPLLESNVTFGRDWLLDMGLAAESSDLSIQYCMSFPRHVMTSVELKSVTQARASDDYHPGNTQWIIGTSSIFSTAIDIMPSKDSYWTMNTPQGGHYTNGTYEPYNRLQSCVLTLSNGPVTFSDRIGYSNASLIMRACNQDGLLLRPETSATMIDRYFIYQSFAGTNSTFAQNYGINGQVWSTTSKVSNHDKYIYLFVANLDESNAITMNDLKYNFKENESESMVDNYLVFETNTTNKYVVFNESNSLTINSCQMYDFQFYTFIPLIYGYPNNNDNDIWYLQGEVDKWISVSKQRFLSIESSDDGGIAVTISGAVNEMVNVAFVNSNTMEQKIVSCTIGETQTMMIKMPAETCQPYM